jgi:hypothetical protein
MTPEEAKEKAVEAIKAGRVAFAPGVAEAINRMDLHKPDFTITGTRLSCWGKWEQNDGGFEINWDTVSAGCGSTTFYLKDGKLRCDNEGCGPIFLKSVLAALLKSAELDDDHPV